MLLELVHETIFDYSEPVREALMELRLTPVTDASQHLLQHRQRVTPPRVVRQYVDGSGNTVSYFNLMAPHDRIEVAFESVVETYDVRHRGSPPACRPGDPVWRLLFHDYLLPTQLTVWCPEFLDFVRPLERLREAPVAEAVETIRETIHGSFRYEGDMTDASSPITDILRLGGGVCQDFAHLMLATCRYLAMPARYVSGYVLPDNGQEAAASHAWCEVFEAPHGWLGVDPTHNGCVGERYVRLGVGRDFRDVPPNRGLSRGTAEETMHVHVHLNPITTDRLEQRARSLFPRARPEGPPAGQPRKPAPMSLMQQSTHAQQQQQQQQQR
jgi:transglutaminase-like putative cysteine protease